MKVLILIEHYQRELETACLIQRIIASHSLNSDIFIYNIFLDEYQIARNNFDVIYFPFFYSKNDTPIHKLFAVIKKLNPNTKLINLAWEQINYGANASLKIPRDKFSKEKVTHLLWNAHNEISYKQAGAKDTINLNISHYNLLNYNLNKSQYLSPIREQYDFSLFFVDNLSWMFYSPGKISELLQNGAEISKVNSLINYCKNYFSLLIKNLALCHDTQLIFRLRPSVSVTKFKKVVKEMGINLPNNFFICQSLSINRLCDDESIVASNNSTILMETQSIGLPTYNLELIPLPPSYQYRKDFASNIKTVSSINAIRDSRIVKCNSSISRHLSHEKPRLLKSFTNSIQLICNSTSLDRRCLSQINLRLIKPIFICVFCIRKALILYARSEMRDKIRSNLSKDIIYHQLLTKVHKKADERVLDYILQ